MQAGEWTVGKVSEIRDLKGVLCGRNSKTRMTRKPLGSALEKNPLWHGHRILKKSAGNELNPDLLCPAIVKAISICLQRLTKKSTLQLIFVKPLMS